MNLEIKVLGAYGSKSEFCDLTSFQINKNIVIDAGSLINKLNNNAKDIKHIFVTHSHLDHIKDIPFLIDNFFEIQTETLNVYGTKETIENMKKHIFNWEIWPDFSKISLLDSKKPALKFITISINESITINNIKIEAIKNNHCNGSCGYIVSKENESILLTSDTYKCPSIWERINKDSKIKSIIIETSFPSSLEQLSISSKHLTPKLLKEELKTLIRKDIRIYVNHLKSNYINQIKKELSEIKDFEIIVLDNMNTIK
jgi:Cft2 family RNA processing exonuclease